MRRFLKHVKSHQDSPRGGSQIPYNPLLPNKLAKHWRWLILIAVLVGVGGWWLLHPTSETEAEEPVAAEIILGVVIDQQRVPVDEAEVTVRADSTDGLELAHAETQPNGRYVLSLPPDIPDQIFMEIERLHFQTYHLELPSDSIALLRNGQPVVMNDITLERAINVSFWIAAGLFAAVLLLIATRKLPNALAAMMGATLLFAISYLGSPISENLLIFEFERGLEYVDWEVIFLIAGMMSFVAVTEETGVFQWLAFAAYRLSRGKMWLLLPILMVIAGVTSAFLDNVTTMLLMTPISIEIALSLGIAPLVLLLPQVMASNVAGISTLIGEPPNILIGSYADISFTDFLVNQTGGVVLAMIGLTIYCEWIYRRELEATDGTSPALREMLAEHARITQPTNLRKAGIVGTGMLLLFIFGEPLNMVPAVTAMLGAVTLLLWVQPDVEEIIEAVDWPTIAFFISLFLLVGGIQEVGLVSMIAQAIGDLVGENLVLAMFVVAWSGAFFSAIVDNIPFTAAMLPVVAFLSTTIPDADNKVLFYCLSVGAAMGGNGTLIGSSANLVTAGIAERAGYAMTYGYFVRKGAPAVVITVSLAMIWLVFRFVVMK